MAVDMLGDGVEHDVDVMPQWAPKTRRQHLFDNNKEYLPLMCDSCDELHVD